jgi:triacylglycerol esterase/lipase EstA (alpha/beta hydrolase family)
LRYSFIIEGYFLDGAVSRFRTATQSPKVTLVAHSMGGLASRVIMEGFGRGPEVDHLVTLGTPHFCRTRRLMSAFCQG